MYDINNIVSSMFGIEMTLAFSNLSHKKKIQLRKKTMPLAAALLETTTFPRKHLCKILFPSNITTAIFKHTAQIQFLSQPCGLSNFFDNFL
jgi:hypothetical protein